LKKKKTSNIRLWLMCANHRSPNHKRHTRILYIVVSTTQPFPMGESLFRRGFPALRPEHGNEPSSTGVSRICGVNLKRMCVFFRAAISAQSEHYYQPRPPRWALVSSRLEDRQTQGSSWPLHCSDKAQPVLEGDTASCSIPDPSSLLTDDACLLFPG